MAVVYGLVCVVTGMIYVGCTSGRITAKRKYNKTVASLLSKRFREHRCCLKANKHSEPELQKDWIAYGEQSFKIVVLEELCEYPPTIS